MMNTLRNLFLFLSMLMSISTASAQFVQQGPKLVGSDAVGAYVWQGGVVALSSDGNTAIVGGLQDNASAGAAWVYTRTGSTWTQQGPKLVGAGAVGKAQQGSGVAISADGSTAIVGAPNDNAYAGAAWVFTRTGNTWTQQGTKLVGSGAVGTAYQGNGVALSADGNTAVVGGSGDNSIAGAAWVFTRTGGTWTQQGSKLVGTGAVGNAQQGTHVALSGDGKTLLVSGGPDNGRAGAAWVFTRTGETWAQQGAKLVGTGAIGTASVGTAVALSFDGNTAVLGGPADNSNTGAVWVFTRSGSTWTQQGEKFIGAEAVGRVEVGISVSLSADGNTVIAGGMLDNAQTGAAWMFTRKGNTWSQLGARLVGTGAAGYAEQGSAVALSSDATTALVGGMNDNAQAGATWVFIRSSTGFAGYETTASPFTYALNQNYPNPFNPSTTISFRLPLRSFVTLKIFDVMGRDVATIVEGELSAGTYSREWNAVSMPSGVFFYRLQTDASAVTRLMLLCK